MVIYAILKHNVLLQRQFNNVIAFFRHFSHFVSLFVCLLSFHRCHQHSKDKESTKKMLHKKVGQNHILFLSFQPLIFMNDYRNNFNDMNTQQNQVFCWVFTRFLPGAYLVFLADLLGFYQVPFVKIFLMSSRLIDIITGVHLYLIVFSSSIIRFIGTFAFQLKIALCFKIHSAQIVPESVVVSIWIYSNSTIISTPAIQYHNHHDQQ